MSKKISMAVVTMIAAGLCVNAAYAHPELQSAGPAARRATPSPKQIRIMFNENVISQFSDVEVKDHAGKLIATGKATTDPTNKKQLVVPVQEALPPGEYKVEWHAVSDDTHRVKGGSPEQSRRRQMSFLILVVDDESDVEDLFRQQFRRDLRAGRFTMDFAQSGDGALQRISDAAGASLILILSDINMPGMSGLELLPKVRAVRPDVPVIMITAYGDADTRRKALEGGAEALLTKPIDFAALRSEIDSRVGRAE
jgi:methionine-rich copper-binding protein CopC/CheY-like chemotaxis protein